MFNWGIISHPINWITIVVMVIIGIMVVNLIMTPFHTNVKTENLS